MPELDGIPAINPICSEFPDVKIIVLTTYTGDVQVVSALRTSSTRSALFMLERGEEHLARFENELGKLDDLIQRLLMLSRLCGSRMLGRAHSFGAVSGERRPRSAAKRDREHLAKRCPVF